MNREWPRPVSGWLLLTSAGAQDQHRRSHRRVDRTRSRAGRPRRPGGTGPAKRGGSDHFRALVRSIAYQQLAGAAASTIHGRFEALFDGQPTPEAVLATPEETLRSAGLSGAKTAAILDLAAKVESGDVPLDSIARLGDDAIIERLTIVRGIGRWTAEMFLMFQLGRLDVWPVDDYGVRRVRRHLRPEGAAASQGARRPR